MCVCVRERERERTGIVETTSGRSDAGLAGAEFIVQVEQAVLAQGGIDTVGTVGQLEVEPGATNSIPRKVKLSLDLRDINGTRRDLILDRSACVLFTPDRISFRFFSFLFFYRCSFCWPTPIPIDRSPCWMQCSLAAAASDIATRRHCSSELKLLAQDPPVECSQHLVELGQRIAADNQLKSKVLVSRAYHDSSFMALRVPTTMLFIPCYKGFSHRPEEYVTPQAVANGVQVLADMLKALSQA